MLGKEVRQSASERLPLTLVPVVEDDVPSIGNPRLLEKNARCELLDVGDTYLAPKLVHQSKSFVHQHRVSGVYTNYAGVPHRRISRKDKRVS